MDANGWESFIRLKSNKETVLDAIFVSLRTKESTGCLISMMTSVDEDNRIIKGIQHFISVDSSRYQREPSEIIDEIQSYRRFVRAIETESRLCSETISRRINERRRSYIRYLKRSADDMLESMRKDDSYIPVYEFEDFRNLDTDRLLCLIS